MLFHAKRRPCQMGAPEIEAFLTDFAIDQKASASRRTVPMCRRDNQVLSARLFYRHALGWELEFHLQAVRAYSRHAGAQQTWH